MGPPRPPFNPYLYRSAAQAESSYRRQLVPLVRSAFLTRDYDTAAAVCAVLLRFKSHRDWAAPHAAGAARPQRFTAETCFAVLEIMLQKRAPNVQVQKFRQTFFQFLGTLPKHPDTLSIRESLVVEQTLNLMVQGDLNQAYSVITSSRIKARRHAAQEPRSYQCNALAALVRYRQWLATALSLLGQQRGHDTRTSVEAWSGDLLAVPFQTASVLSQRGAAVVELRELMGDLQHHVEAALEQHISGVQLPQLLAHAYVCCGHVADAGALLQRVADAAPSDLSARALLAAWSSASGATGEGEHGPVAVMAGRFDKPGQPAPRVTIKQEGERRGRKRKGRGWKHCKRCNAAAAAMQLDPTCAAPLRELLREAQHCPTCSLAAARGCLLYLDVSPPAHPLAESATAWHQLAALLMQAAGDAARAQEAMQGTRDGGLDNPARTTSSLPADSRQLWASLGGDMAQRRVWWSQVHWWPEVARTAMLTRELEGPAPAGQDPGGGRDRGAAAAEAWQVLQDRVEGRTMLDKAVVAALMDGPYSPLALAVQAMLQAVAAQRSEERHKRGSGRVPANTPFGVLQQRAVSAEQAGAGVEGILGEHGSRCGIETALPLLEEDSDYGEDQFTGGSEESDTLILHGHAAKDLCELENARRLAIMLQPPDMLSEGNSWPINGQSDSDSEVHISMPRLWWLVFPSKRRRVEMGTV